MLLAIAPAAVFAEESLDFLGFDEASYSEEGKAGLRQILSGTMFDTSYPFMALKMQAATNSNLKDQLGYDPTSDEGRFYTQGALPSLNEDDDPAMFLGMSKVKDNEHLVSLNCFMCHSGVVNGQVVAGLGSSSILQQRSQNPEDRGKVVRGDNYGQYAVWRMAARIADPAKTGLLTADEETELTKLIEATQLPTAQPQPWWLMKYKVKDYWYGDAAPDDAAAFSLNFSASNERVNEHHADHVAFTDRALAFARETQSPIFPEKLDPELVKIGDDLFHGTRKPADASKFKACFECHGSYDRFRNATDYSIPGSWSVDYRGSEELKDVGTDSGYNDVVQKFRPIIEHLMKLEDYYEAQGTPELYPKSDPLRGKGYVPPPLVGIWATAPYFHNGAVPTLEAVLNSKLRPEIWVREQGPYAYDLENVGLVYSPVSRAEYDASAEKAVAAENPLDKAVIDHTYLYDTTAYGRSKDGHTFGDSLNDLERSALIEFLKSLSGPDMPGKPQPMKQAKLNQ